MRKVRWSRDGGGKRGGIRIITFYTGVDLPLFLITVYGKGAVDNLSKAEVNDMRRLISILKEASDILTSVVFWIYPFL